MKEKLNVLLIEDNSADEKLLATHIKKDYQVSLQRVENEEQFRDELNKALPDIILSDYNLPSFNGMDALKIRKQIAPLVPFILITGTINEETAVKVMKEGADDYILKDSLKRLSPAIDSALKKMADLKAKEDTEKKLNEVLEHSVNLFYSHDVNGVLKYVSPQSKQYLGCEPEEALIRWTEFITDNPVNSLGVESTNKTIETGIPQLPFELELKKKNGEKIWVEVRETPVVKEGKTVSVVGSLTDITEKRKALVALNQSENKYRNLVEDINDIVYSVDEKGRIIFISSAAERVMGFKTEEITGKNFTKFIHQDDLRNATENFSNISKNKTNIGEYRIRTKTGEFRSMTVSSTGIFKDSVLTGVTGVLVDVTEEKKAEEKIKFQSRLLDEIGEAVMATDLEGRIIYWNNGAEKLYGWKKEEVIGRNVIDVTPNDASVDTAKEIFNKLAEGKSWTGEFSVRRKDGTSFTAMVNDSPVFNDNCNLMGIIGISTDITEKKKMIEELISSKEKAEEANKLKSYFLANMSHELRTPMVGILGFAEVLMEELTEPDHIEMVSTIINSGTRLIATLNSVLDLSRIEANRQDINTSLVNLNEVIKEVVHLYNPVIKKKKVYFKYFFPEKNIFLNSDRDILNKIFNNLINNAVKYTHLGIIIVKLSVQDKDADKKVLVEISDTGIGIPEEFHKTIFEPFRQVSEGFSRRFDGNGLGLSITKKFIELLNGSISLESIPGKGSKFSVTFPLINGLHDTTSTTEKVQTVDDISSLIINEMSVLLVEDDPVNAAVICAYLKDYMKIDHVSDGQAAIKICGSKQYSAVLMDINLKGIDGVETLNYIRKLNSQYANIPVIAITAYAMSGDREKFLSLGFTHYLSKPFERSQLLSLLSVIFKNN